MKLKRKWNAFLLVVLSIAAILAGGSYYITSVQNSLWTEAVTDILEVTSQGRHALDTYIEKDMEMLHWLAAKLSKEDLKDTDALQDVMDLSSMTKSSYLCVNLDTGAFFTDLLDDSGTLSPDELDSFLALEGNGIREPFLENRTGVWTIGYYEHFLWPDGTEGMVQKTQPLSEISERFSLSFYNDSGFSYVVNQEGDILIRSQHRNSNRTFQNLFDIIDLHGNSSKEISSFRDALAQGQKGVARFQYQEEDYVFCYVPMDNADGWYVVSIVPNHVIMEQADHIVQNSQLFLFLILTCILVLAAFFIVYKNSTRRVLQAEEQARKAAESANIAKSRFLSNMSHDIRTPMNAIIGMAKLADDHVEEPEKIKKYLKNISLSGQLLVGLINDILDMSKIESGKMSLNNDTASLKTLLDNLVNIIQSTVTKKNQKFDIRLHEIEHETLCFDALRLNQILLNLLSNAVKFTPEGGSITLDVTERPSTRENCAHFIFCAKDTGIGIKPEFLDRLFDSFTREQDSRISKIEGSGLGMAITKMIVDMMEGSIEVESKPGEGSTFIVRLDLNLSGDVPEEYMALPAIRILFADDDSDTCRSAQGFLQELGVTADTAENGYTAVEKALSAYHTGNCYDLVLLDWRMPDLNGFETAKKIREQTGEEIPIIVVSAYDWSSIEEQASKAGINDFIQKPIFKSSLYHCICQHVMHITDCTEKQNNCVDLTDRHFLLAEDNELNQQIVLEILTGAGAQVEVTSNGQACVDCFECSVPGYYDIILMDIQMPVMNGYEATKRIRSMDRPDASSIPIFAMTADAFSEDIASAKKAGMSQHLAKPLDLTAMMREIQKYLKG